MFIKLIKYFWSLKRQFFKYFIVGISGMGIDFVFLIFFKEIAGLAPIWAGALSQVFSITFIFLANKYWSFSSAFQTHKQLVRYLIVLGFDYLYCFSAMYVGTEVWDFDYRLVRLVTVAIMVSWNFFLYKYFVYRKPPVVIENVDEVAKGVIK
jgi:putative flippase GtrA